MAAIKISSASSLRGGVGCVDAESAAAGMDALRSGGNAADAAAAIILTACVTKIELCCIGGEAVGLVYEPGTGRSEVLCGQGTAPGSEEAISWYMDHGIPGPASIASASVPATLDCCVTLLRRYGTRTFSDTASVAMDLLAEGRSPTYLDAGCGRRIDGVSGKIVGDESPESTAEGGWSQDLLGTFRKLCDSEARFPNNRDRGLCAVSDRFYRGDIATDLVRWYRERGGWLREPDLEGHRSRIEDPVSIQYRGYTILKAGAWTQGPSLLQALSVLEQFDGSELASDTGRRHLLVESIKLAFADRDEYYGDPLYADVALDRMLSDEYAALRSRLIDRGSVTEEVRAGDPLNMRPLMERPPRTGVVVPGTTPIVAADDAGRVVVITLSGCGSRAGSGGTTGITHGIRLRNHNTWPSHPNRIEAGKRPRSTLSPTMILKDGKPVLGVSCTTSDHQEQFTLQLIVDLLDRGLRPLRALAEPRVYTPCYINSFGPKRGAARALHYDHWLPEESVERLKALGYGPEINTKSVGRMLVHLDGDMKNIYGFGACSAL